MRVLLPFLALYRRHPFRITLGILLAIATLVASISLLSLSGWFLSATALAGFAGLYTFNYMLPAGGVRGSAIIRTAARYGERLVSHDATFRVLSHLRVFTFRKIFPLSPGKMMQFRQAELLNRLVADVETLDHLYLRLLSPLASALIVIALVTIGLTWLDVTLALTLGGIMIALLLCLPLPFYRAGKPIGVALTELRSQYRIQVTTWLQGQAELVIFGAEKSFREQLHDTQQIWQQQQQKQSQLSALSQALMVIAAGLTVTLMLWLAAGGVAEWVHPGALLALIVFTALAAFEALAPVAGAFQHLGQVIASAERVSHLMAQEPCVHFPAVDETKPLEISAALEIRQLTFHYPQQARTVLHQLSLSLAPTEHVALLGPTGCGKSTLLQLITRAWDPDRGDILLNGCALRSYSEATLRQQISVVTQRVHLFSATLRDNLLLAAPQASDEQLTEQLHQVGLEALCERDGLNQWMGEGGRQLSGGELRRLGIARALLHNAPLMLLDEPTEGLDAETEQQILALLHTQCQNKTLLIITHRLTGLSEFDRICVMDEGQIIEQGSHQTLLTKQGRYAQLYERQF